MLMGESEVPAGSKCKMTMTYEDESGKSFTAEKEFEISTEGFSDSRLELIVDVSLTGRHSNGPVKVVLFAGK